MPHHHTALNVLMCADSVDEDDDVMNFLLDDSNF
jgi:hypothetical protein